MSRPITILAVVQIACIVMGFFGLGIVLKVSGYPNQEMVTWSDLAVFLRSHGLWLTLVPVCWAAITSVSFAKDRSELRQQALLNLGVTLCVAFVCAFLWASLDPYSRVLLVLPTR